ncbi:MAG: TerB N-terminal domain-containing protein [Prevotella sp.]|jgi:hypothetical protein
MMSSHFNTTYDDEPLFPNADDFKGSVGGGSWDYVAPEDSLVPTIRTTDKKSSIGSPPSDVPKRIMKLLEMMEKDNWTITRNRAFYHQAKLMADYDDHADIVPFHCYYPTYSSMTIAQLRSYFSIRLLLRQGKVPTVPLSYLFVYVYELLMKIGCDTAEEAYEQLKELYDNYRTSEPSINRYLHQWLQDFVVYNNLTDHIAEIFSTEREEDSKALVLVNRDKVSDALLFQTVTSLSNYSITGGALYKKQPKAVEAIVPRVIRAVAPLFEENLHHRFVTLCMGKKLKASHPMFESAVFYDPQPVRQQEVEISLRRKYVCLNGLWTVTVFSPFYAQRGGPIGSILHETDRRLRLTLKVGPKIQRKPILPDVVVAIQQTINAWLREEEEAKRPKVSVDFSKLDRIRNDADVVRDALLTDEEKEESVPQQPATSPEPVEESETAGVFSDEETGFLDMLLNGGDWQEYLRNLHVPLGVMVDGINTKAMDWIGDIVVEDNGDGPVVIEDYQEDVENEIKK